MCGSGITLDKIHAHSSECAVVDMRVHRERRAAEGNTRDDEKRGATYRYLDGIPGTERRKSFLHRVPGHLLPVQQLDDVCGPIRGGVDGGAHGVVGRLGERRSDGLSRDAR